MCNIDIFKLYYIAIYIIIHIGQNIADPLSLAETGSPAGDGELGGPGGFGLKLRCGGVRGAWPHGPDSEAPEAGGKVHRSSNR